MKALKHLFTFILLVILQFFIFGLVGLSVIGFGELTLLLPPLGIILCLIVFYIIIEINIYLNRKFMYIKLKTFILGYMLPISAIYIAVEIIFLTKRGGTISDGGTDDIYSVMMALIPVFSLLIFIITSCFSIKKCKYCGERGFSLFKLERESVKNQWYEDAGEGTTYKNVKVRGYDGNTYNGRIEEDTQYVKKYEEREYVCSCRNCKRTVSHISKKKVGLIQKIIDIFTKG